MGSDCSEAHRGAPVQRRAPVSHMPATASEYPPDAPKDAATDAPSASETHQCAEGEPERLVVRVEDRLRGKDAHLGAGTG